MAEETKGSDSTAAELEADGAFMDLYSRQIGTLGIATMAKLVQVKALIVGVKGVGIEIAKNLTLAGLKAVTLFDNTVASHAHQGGNFFIGDDDVASGRTLAAASGRKLAEVNEGVRVGVTAELSEETVLSHDVVVFTEGARKDLTRWNQLCRTNTRTATKDGVEVTVPAPVAFISVVCMGAYGSVFSDFGPAFTIRDCDGEEPVTRIVTGITPEGRVQLLPAHENGKRADVTDDEHCGWVTFSHVKGMEDGAGGSINDVERFRARAVFRPIKRAGRTLKAFDAYQLDIGDVSRFSAYVDGGYMTQVKVPVTKSHNSMSQTMMSPGDFIFTDGAKWDRGPQLHLALQGVYAFQEETGCLPEPNNAAHAAAVVAKVKQLNAAAKLINATCGEDSYVSVEEVDEAVVTNVALFAAVELQPVATFFGGVVAHECVKLAGTFTPLNQWLHLDWFEVLPEERPTDAAPLDCRYDNQIAVFGKAFQDKLAASTTFLVGCGGSGCELLKNLAMVGLGCGSGSVHCTDNDTIKVSNLNRQFLSRPCDVGKQKSDALAAAAKAINPALNVKAYTKPVMPATEDVFNDEFWEGLSFVTNALDNIKAREYVDGRCVLYEKALLESATLGAKCSTQVIVPHLTQSYTDGPEHVREDFDPCPMSTPSLISHCIEWARAQFSNRFAQVAAEAAKFCGNRDTWVAGILKNVRSANVRASAVAYELSRVRAVQQFLDQADGATFETAVALAASMFHECFRDKIQHLVDVYPEDHVAYGGGKYWSGARHFPTATKLDLDNELHVQFITSTANILACNLALRPPPEAAPLPTDHDWRSVKFVKSILAATPVPPYVPLTVVTDDDAAETEFEAIMQDLATRTVATVAFEPAKFEPDRDDNFHLDFIHAAANLRAVNFSIPGATRHATKMIAGNILPAIATATAASSGLVVLEMYKLVAGKTKLGDFRSSSNHLGLNQYIMMEPSPPHKAKAEFSDVELCDVTPKPDGFTKWDKTIIDCGGHVTLRQFCAAFKGQTGLNITTLYHPCSNSYDADYLGRFLYCEGDDASEPFQDTPLVDYIKQVYPGSNAITGTRHWVPLGLTCEDDEGEAYIVPQLVFKL